MTLFRKFRFSRIKRQYENVWLWKDVNIGPHGRYLFTVPVPERPAHWMVSAFSVSPTMGFGMLPTAIQVSTIIVTVDVLLTACEFWWPWAVLHTFSLIHLPIYTYIPKWSFTMMISHQNCTCISYYIHSYYILWVALSETKYKVFLSYIHGSVIFRALVHIKTDHIKCIFVQGFHCWDFKMIRENTCIFWVITNTGYGKLVWDEDAFKIVVVILS